MDAGRFDFVAGWNSAAGQIQIRLAVGFSCLLTAALALSAILLAGRRLAGGLEQPLPLAMLAAASGLAALLAAAARIAMPSVGSAKPRAMFVARWVPAPLLAIFVASLSVPGTSTTALAAAWGIVVAEELLAWRWFRASPPRLVAPSQPREPESPLAVSRVAVPLGAAAESLPASSLALPPSPAVFPSSSLLHSPEIVQQQTRSHLASGTDRLSGWLRMSLATGERNATAHIAFCPPFLATPKISLRQTAGPAGRIRAVQILPHGVRLELKVDLSPRQPQRLLVEFVAETPLG